MSREKLQQIIETFDLHRFKRFFSEKNRSFRESSESIYTFSDQMFRNGQKLGDIQFEDGSLIVCAIEATKELTERSGKKAQYELGKKILKSTQTDSGIFIFYNQVGAFRFSLIYANYLGKNRDWSSFKRCTYFVSSDLTNKTFLKRIGDGDFSSLTKIKEAFSVEKVTKEFYANIANWYFWAVENCRFPKDAEAEENGRNISVIRLITRMIFIWFMRERGLVPRDLFRRDKIASILKDLSDEKSGYYHAILQNMFFATLSTKQSDRKFRSEVRGHKGINPDFGNHNVYRYHELFKVPEKIEDYFGAIPFLNGGLFECLDDKPKGIYIDGFTSVKKNQPEVPNQLFFSSEKKADLNAAYGTKGKSYKVKGLLDILSSFNFTIDENSPDDQDIALDPELLGRVFENLLASYNPETASTARKATGSYYTPREIVDYMVTESLKAYFKTHLNDIEDIDKKLDKLFQTGSEENPFGKKESAKIVDLIESVRIVDPAVGSGAFPMGALNKLVFILNKLDPGNELWKQAQLSAADSIPDPRIKKDTKARIEEFFKSKNADYGRKLYLIQKCIYGVDIQEIAVEIAKLRFFISLLVDEKIDSAIENMGIEPLPNLDFKIMQGNSLISEYMGIDFDNGTESSDTNGQTSLIVEPENDRLIKEFEQKKIEFQNEPDKEKKDRLKQEIDDLMIRLFESKLKKQKADYFRKIKVIEEKYSALPDKQKREEIISKEKQSLSKKEGFDLEKFEAELREMSGKNKTKPFFAWKLYFAEVFRGGNQGFDIVIGNPPYIRIQSLAKSAVDYLKTRFESATGKFDVYVCFIELGLLLLNKSGKLAFINPNKFLNAGYGVGLRKLLSANHSIYRIVDFSDSQVFHGATNYTCILLLDKNSQDTLTYIDVTSDTDITQLLNLGKTGWRKRHPETATPWNFTDSSTDNLIKRFSDMAPLSSYCSEIFQGVISGADKLLYLRFVSGGNRVVRAKSLVNGEIYEIESDLCYKLLKGSEIRRYATAAAEFVVVFPYTEVQDKTRLIPEFALKRDFPKAYNYLRTFKTELANRGSARMQYESWYALWCPRPIWKFRSKKILTQVLSARANFCLDSNGEFMFTGGGNAGVYGIIPKDSENLIYLLALLNSRLLDYLLKARSTQFRGGYFSYAKRFIELLPIPEPTKVARDKIRKLVDCRSKATSEKVFDIEEEINSCVYNIYDLTPEEIAVVEGNSK